jgi:tetratricopeptide (TPR) repeat protein
VGREPAPDHLPRGVLQRPDFTQACAQRDLGEVLRIAKQWGGLGFTASHLARRCEMTVSRVQDYIAGRVQAQRVEVFERVSDGLHIPGRMFDLGRRPWERSTTSEHVGVNESVGPSNEKGEPPVLRRDFVKLGAGLAAGTLAGQMPGEPSGVAGRRVGSSTVDAVRANLARLRALDDHLGGADTYGFYLEELEKVRRLLKDGEVSGRTHRELLTLNGEVAQQAGWAAFDAGWQREAQRHYKESFAVAKEVDDRALIGNALALRSYQALSTGSVNIDLTEKACSIAAASRQPAVKSLLYQRGAWTYAMAGDAERTAKALDNAQKALTATDGEEGPDWARWAHNSTEWRIMAGRCWAELHKPLRAVPILETAMSEYDDSHARDKALYLSWLADAYLDAGELEHAVSVTGHSLDLADGVASVRPRERLGAVLSRLEGHESAAGVKDLLARRPVNPVKVRR